MVRVANRQCHGFKNVCCSVADPRWPEQLAGDECEASFGFHFECWQC